MFESVYIYGFVFYHFLCLHVKLYMCNVSVFVYSRHLVPSHDLPLYPRWRRKQWKGLTHFVYSVEMQQYPLLGRQRSVADQTDKFAIISYTEIVVLVWTSHGPGTRIKILGLSRLFCGNVFDCTKLTSSPVSFLKKKVDKARELEWKLKSSISFHEITVKRCFFSFFFLVLSRNNNEIINKYNKNIPP